ncbi:hypothetical protein K1X84_10610 [bacterium]|nr:hypothetical protein [bacterium]
MSRLCSCFLWLLLGNITLVFAQNQAHQFSIDSSAFFFPQITSPHSINLFKKEYRFVGKGNDAGYSLPDSMIVLGSEEIYAGKLLLKRNDDYRIDYKTGGIKFNFELSADVEIRVVYKIFPFGIPKPAFHRELITHSFYDDSLKRTIQKNIITVNEQSGNLFETSQLRGSGSITRGFSVGSNQDFTLNSGLNVQISGNISDDVTLEASLTDENLPIQPEGNTENLQEIDKVFVEVKKADRYIATFGDFNVNYSGTQFGNYSRQVQGVRASGKTDRWFADAAFATSKGKYATNTLTIQEGVQGPYELTGRNGERNVLIIAGTEKVWLNGVLLIRGEDNDYVVDYSAGQITFTRKRLITSESRIVVDFEYADDVFRRNTLSLRAGANWFNNKIALRSLFINEYDDKSNPINLSLSESTLDSLSMIDDDSLAQRNNSILVDGATRSDIGKGTYRKAFDIASAESIYVYVGRDSSGDYNVRFTDFGNGNGAYSRGSILGEFIYVGQGNGNYLPLVPLSLPTQTQIGVFNLDVRPAKNILIAGELAFSNFDRNAYSAKSQNGQAYYIHGNIDKQKIKIGNNELGEVDFTARFRRVDSTFTQIDRVDDAEFARNWNALPLNANYAEELDDGLLRYRPIEKLQLTSFYGQLNRGNGSLKSERYGGGGQYDFKSKSFIAYNVEKISSDSKTSSGLFSSQIRRQYLNSAYEMWKTTLGMDYEDEVVDNMISVTSDSNYGTGYQIFRPKADFTGFDKIRWGVMYEWRFDRQQNEIDSLDGRVSVSTIQKYYTNIIDWKSLNGSIEFIRREKKFEGSFKTADHPDKITRLINSDIDYSPFNRAVQIDVNYQISEERIQDRKIIFIPVQPNTGNFVRVDADSFKQVPQGQGDYIQGSVRGNNFTPVVDLKFGFRFRFEPVKFLSEESIANGGTWINIMRYLSTETLLRVEENQTNPATGFYFIDLNKFQNEENTIKGSLLFRQDIYGFQTSRDFSIRLRYELQKNMTNLLVDGNEQRKRELENLRIRKQLSPKWAIESEWEYEINRKYSTIQVSGLNIDFNIYKIKFVPLVSFRPVQEWEWRNKFYVSYGKDRLSLLTAKSLSYQPEIIFSFKEKGRANLNVELTRMYVKKTNFALPFELIDGNNRGWNARWFFTAEYRISNHVSASVNYSGRKEPGIDTVHIGGAEFRAFF